MINLVGKVVFSDEMYVSGHKLYSSLMQVLRTSGVIDNIMLRSNERLPLGYIEVYGVIRSYHSVSKYKKTSQEVFVKSFSSISDEAFNSYNKRDKTRNDVNENVIILSINKVRETPGKKKIVEMRLKSLKGQRYGWNAIAWGDDAEKLVELGKGAKVHINGRLQSREYEKCGEKVEIREVSISNFKIM